MKSIFLHSLAILSGLSFVACNKDSCKTSKISSASLSYEKPLYKGFPLRLYTESSTSYFYRFRGPNHLDINTSNESTYYVHSSTDADTGFYTVQISNNDCVIKDGKVRVVFDTPPAPPCAIANNTSTTNTVGIGGVSYGYVSMDLFGSPKIVGQASNQSLHIQFQHDFTPKPGVYNSTMDNSPDAPNEVYVYIIKSQTYVMLSGTSVYINEVNGKLQVSFCNADFSYSTSSPNVTISAKLTVP